MQLAAFARIVSCMCTVVSAQLVHMVLLTLSNQRLPRAAAYFAEDRRRNLFRIIQKAQLSPGKGLVVLLAIGWGEMT